MTTPKLTRKQAAIIGAFTGFVAGQFADIQRYAEKALGRTLWTHHLADKALADELKQAARADFLAICADDDQQAQR